MNKSILLKKNAIVWPALPVARVYSLVVSIGVPLVVPLIVPLALLALWYISTHYGWMPSQILPAPDIVAKTAVELWHNDLLPQLFISLQRLASGLLAGVLAGTR